MVQHASVFLDGTVDPQLPGPQVSGHWNYPNWVGTVQSECFVKMCVLLKYNMGGVLQINVWASIL